METRWEVHLAAAGLTALLIGAIVLFWSYPRLLIYLLLAVVAALSYGALYLILAARMDPRRSPEMTRAPPVARGAAPQPAAPPKKAARSRTQNKPTKALGKPAAKKRPRKKRSSGSGTPA